MCNQDLHFYSTQELFDLLNKNSKDESNFLCLDFNHWQPHVASSLEIACFLSSNGFKVFYEQKKFGFRPKFGKPFFGYRSHVSKNWIRTNGLLHVGQNMDDNIEDLIDCKSAQQMMSQLKLARSRVDLSNLTHENFDYGYAILSTLASTYGRGEISEYLIRKVAPGLLKEYVETVNRVNRSIKSNNINHLVLFNGRFVLESAARSAAEAVDIKVIYHEASKNSRFIVSCFSPHSRAGYLELCKKITSGVEKSLLLLESDQWYESRIGGNNPDSALFQTKWKPLENGKNRTSNGRKITIFTTSDDEYLGLSREWDLPHRQSQLKWLTDIAFLALSKGYDVTLRLHPNLITKSKRLQKDWLAADKIPNLEVIGFGDTTNSYNLITTSDLIITCGSTIAMEAGYLGKPVLSVGTGIYDLLQVCIVTKDLSEIGEILDKGKFHDLIPNRDQIAIFGYVEKNKFKDEVKIFKSNQERDSVLKQPSTFNRLASKIYREVFFKFL